MKKYSGMVTINGDAHAKVNILRGREIMIAELVNKKDNKIYEIYDITYDKAGYPHFLIYKNGEWVRVSAKHFRPTDYTDIVREFNMSSESMMLL